ncbi:MAG: hypothetical protein EOO38_12995 [Cytophagaceae bacterium]|nr:MAG: hypothetical protein EOO38_12995 [Cytophagaceae bacterium]
MTKVNSLTIEDVGKMLVDVTQSMFDERFLPDDKRSDLPNLGGMAFYGRILTLAADNKIDLVCLCSAHCGVQLTGKILHCSEAEVEADVIGDAIGELVNVVAGQVKSFLGTSHVIGLPRDFNPASEKEDAKNLPWQGRLYHSPAGTIHLWLGIRMTE